LAPDHLMDGWRFYYHGDVVLKDARRWLNAGAYLFVGGYLERPQFSNNSLPPMRYFGLLRTQVHLQGLAHPELPKVWG
jgi:hypothetical protein